MLDSQPSLPFMRSVYSVPWPEIQDRFSELQIPKELWRVTASLESHDEFLKFFGFDPLTPGTQKLGFLDCWNEPLIKSIGESLKLPEKIANFNSYPVAGSAQGIGGLLTDYANRGCTTIWVPEGDYEGYEYQAQAYGIDVIYFNLASDKLPMGQTVFMSQPSAINGDFVNFQMVQYLADHNELILDLAYRGLTFPNTFFDIPENCEAVLWSASKPYGLFYRRIGFLWSKTSINNLYASRWFKNPEHLWALAVLMKEFPLERIAKKAKSIQTQIVSEYTILSEKDLIQSDVSLLAQSAEPWYADWVRDTDPHSNPDRLARVCLSPLIEELLDNIE